MHRTDHLQRVDNDQRGVRMLRQKCLHLFFQPLTNDGALRAEVDAVRRVLGDFKQAVLDAEDGILQAEIEGGTLPGGHVPDPFPLGYRHRQPQRQPGLAHLGGARQDMQALRNQGIHHKADGLKRLGHQRGSIHRFQQSHMVHSLRYYFSVIYFLL